MNSKWGKNAWYKNAISVTIARSWWFDSKGDKVVVLPNDERETMKYPLNQCGFLHLYVVGCVEPLDLNFYNAGDRIYCNHFFTMKKGVRGMNPFVFPKKGLNVFPYPYYPTLPMLLSFPSFFPICVSKKSVNDRINATQ